MRSFQRPFIAPARLQENIDRLLLAITMKLKSKSRAPTVLSFHHDCYRFLFFGKGRPSKDGKSTMLEKDDFARCNFHDLWEQCLDKLGWWFVEYNIGLPRIWLHSISAVRLQIESRGIRKQRLTVFFFMIYSTMSDSWPRAPAKQHYFPYSCWDRNMVHMHVEAQLLLLEEQCYLNLLSLVFARIGL